jgi:thiamine kinase-like enzyme
MDEIPQGVISAFEQYTPDLPDHSPGKITVDPIGHGLINRSYKINCELKPPFLLQQINKHVFPDPSSVQENYINIWEYAAFEFTGLRLPYPKYYNNNSSLFKDENGNYWRAFELIENCYSINVPKTPSQARATAKEFAKFTVAFNDFNLDQLRIVIPDFHNLMLRYEQFEEAFNGAFYERMPKALPLAEELKQREHYKHFFESITASGEFPQRVMHHDAKISNVLFDEETDTPVCLVDFDTVMPGYFFSDIGDMIRTMVCPVDETNTEFEKIKIRKTYYDAIINGYLSVMKDDLTTSEKENIHYAGLLMTYMQALRFLADYLNGDIYYKTQYPEQNFDRAKNQLTLLSELEKFLKNNYSFKSWFPSHHRQ